MKLVAKNTAEPWAIKAESLQLILEALTEAEYFFGDDFPDGPDGPCHVTLRYRDAYKKVLAAKARVKAEIQDLV